MNDLLSLQEAAEVLGVSRRRIQALVDTGQLAAARLGSGWAVDVGDVRHFERVRRRSAGAPMSALMAWSEIARLDPRWPKSRLDESRRRVHTRAEHRIARVHPSVIARLRHPSMTLRHVVSGGDAAAEHDVPVGSTSSMLHAYIRKRDQASFDKETQPATVSLVNANLALHIVPDEAWPFHGERFTALNVAWLDMADHGERGADMVLDAWRQR